MHDGVLAYLRCPVCGEPLSTAGRALRCPRGHSFDLARQGYVDLTAGRATHEGDSAAMVAARDLVHAAGHLDPVVEAVDALIPTYHHGLLIEVGAGTGHYLASVLDHRPGPVGLAVDVSKPALRRAARAHPRMAAVRADVWRGLPVADGAAEAVLDVFAPRSAAEFHRVLRPGGLLVVAVPTPEHLGELRDAIGLLDVDPDKQRRLSAELDPWFTPGEVAEHRATLRLTGEEVRALVAMGPSARHLDPAELAARTAALSDARPDQPVEVTASVRVGVWHARRIRG